MSVRVGGACSGINTLDIDYNKSTCSLNTKRKTQIILIIIINNNDNNNNVIVLAAYKM